MLTPISTSSVPGSVPLEARAEPTTAQVILGDALTIVDETVLATRLRVTVPTLRRYASGTLRMNWVMRTRLAEVIRVLRASTRPDIGVQ
ncbi:MAG: hypothetical protein ABJF01_18515 [bacterium]